MLLKKTSLIAIVTINVVSSIATGILTYTISENSYKKDHNEFAKKC
jgi:hypothetical protein